MSNLNKSQYRKETSIETDMSHIHSSFSCLETFCSSELFKGWDPYDGLNSRIFQATPLKNWRFARLAWIQFFKRSPINFRKIFLVEKDFNPKGLALFLSGYCNLYSINPNENYLDQINKLAENLIKSQSKGFSGACWGYNFHWQDRVFYQPKYTPMVVVTSFAANALFDAYELTKNKDYLEIALSSCEFVVKDLNRYSTTNGFIFSYSPLDHSRIYNASLLGARLLARGYNYIMEKEWLNLSGIAVNTIVDKQNEDGSWFYGDARNHIYIDSFHTGFNLECIHDYMLYTKDTSYQKALTSGLQYYIENFVQDDGTPKYYNNQTYPIDIHSPAQFIVTIIKLGLFNTYRNYVDLVLNWTINNMQDEKGYFYYQLKRLISCKIPYIRWSQAWMFYAFSEYLKSINCEDLD